MELDGIGELWNSPVDSHQYMFFSQHTYINLALFRVIVYFLIITSTIWGIYSIFFCHHYWICSVANLFIADSIKGFWLTSFNPHTWGFNEIANMRLQPCAFDMWELLLMKLQHLDGNPTQSMYLRYAQILYIESPDEIHGICTFDKPNQTQPK